QLPPSSGRAIENSSSRSLSGPTASTPASGVCTIFMRVIALGGPGAAGAAGSCATAPCIDLEVPGNAISPRHSAAAPPATSRFFLFMKVLLALLDAWDLKLLSEAPPGGCRR